MDHNTKIEYIDDVNGENSITAVWCLNQTPKNKSLTIETIANITLTCIENIEFLRY